jgi:lipopolysaccharide transport system permease protein
VGETGIPYPAFVLIGTMLWQSFAEAMNAPLTALIASRALLIKLKFPYEAPIVSALLMTSFFAAVRLLLLIPIFIFVELTWSWMALLFPLGYFALLVLGLSLGLMVTPIGLLYTDVGRAIRMGITIVMYLTPVVYPLAESGFLYWMNRINPVTYVLETARDIVTAQPLDLLWPAISITIAAGLLTLMGGVILRMVMPHLIARMGM